MTRVFETRKQNKPLAIVSEHLKIHALHIENESIAKQFAERQKKLEQEYYECCKQQEKKLKNILLDNGILAEKQINSSNLLFIRDGVVFMECSANLI